MAASSRRLLCTAATASGNVELPIPIARLRSLARAGRLDDIDTDLAPFIQSHPATAISTLSVLGLPDRASAILSTICSPTSVHLNSLLAPLLRRRSLAMLVPGFLAAHPSVPRDDVTDSILGKALCRISGADSALYLLNGEKTPSLQLYTSVIDSYYKQKKAHRAEELWRAMVEDHGIAPDTAAYNVKITYKSTNGTVEEVEELIRVMREEVGLQPDVVSYNALMRVLVRHKKVDRALEVYRMLQDEELKEGSTAAKKSVPDCATYTCVLGALCGAERWSEAEDVLYEGLKRRKVPDLGTVSRLVRGLKETGKGRAARRVVVGLRKKFPYQFDGPWLLLEDAAGLKPGSGNAEDEGEEDEPQPAQATAA